jgi:hypothetical protein
VTRPFLRCSSVLQQARLQQMCRRGAPMVPHACAHSETSARVLVCAATRSIRASAAADELPLL